MLFVYHYGIILIFAVSTILSLLSIQENRIFIGKPMFSNLIYGFCCVAFTYNIVSLSRNFLSMETLYYMPLLVMIAFRSYWFTFLSAVTAPIVLSLYLSFWYPNYSGVLVIKLITSGLFTVILLMLITLVIKSRLFRILISALIVSLVEFYQNTILNNGQSLNYEGFQIFLTFLGNIALGIFVYWLSNKISQITTDIQKKLLDYDRDELTGLYNYRRLNKDILNVASQSTSELTLVIIDIDYFKKFNDTYGHTYGNIILQLVATSVKQIVSERFKRSEYKIYRYGGEELIITLNGTVTDINVMLEELRLLFNNLSIKDHNQQLTLSIGVSFNKNHNFDNLATFKKADSLLYKVKKEGRDNYLIELLPKRQK